MKSRIFRSISKGIVTTSLCFLVPLTVYSQYTIKDSDVVVVGGVITACTTSSTEWETGDIIIPDFLDGQVVKELGERTFELKGITSVSLPQSLEIIGDRCFAINNMVELIIPKSIIFLGRDLFAAMNSMRNVYFEDQSNIRIISAGALFVGSCVNCMNPITFPDNVNPDFSGYRNLNSLAFEPGDTIKDLLNCFYAEMPVHTLSQEDVIMKDSAISDFISRYPKISIPASINGIPVNTIGAQAFLNASVIEVQLSDAIEYIHTNAFNNNLLSNVILPDGLKEIGDYAFSRNRLTALDIPATLKSIGPFAFFNNDISSIQLPETVLSVGNAAFNGNQIITINGTVTDGLIFNRLSNGSWDSTTIVSYGGVADTINFIPQTVKTLGDNAFYNSNLNWVVFPESIETIGIAAFFNNSLDSIVLPSSIVRLNQQAFSANYIKKVSFKEPCHLEFFGLGIFNQNYQLDSVVLPVPLGKFGYGKYLGWFDDMGDSVSVIKNMWNRPCEAKFEPIRYPITYENVTVNSIYNPDYYTIESNYYLDEPEHIPEYRFAGWFTDPFFNDTISEPAIPRGSSGDITFYAKWENSTGIEQSAEKTVSVYPVPFREVLNISVTEPYDVTVYDAAGVIHHHMVIEAGNNTLNIEKSQPGLYFIRLKSGTRTIMKKVILE